MSSESHNAELLGELESRSSRVEQQLWRLWLPGWRLRLFNESYDIGYRSRQLGAIELAEKNLHRALTLMDHRKVSRSKASRQIFHIVAHCHNNLGIIHLDQNQMTDANVEFDKAITLRRELQRLSSDDRENDVYLAGSLCNRGHATASTNPDAAADFYAQSLAILRQPDRTCECSYWDEQRQSWWCENLEALGDAIGLQWVALAPQYVDNAMRGLQLLETRRGETE